MAADRPQTDDTAVGTPLGVIVGSAFMDAFDPDALGVELARETVETGRGVVRLLRGPRCVLLRRHGEDVYRPPHRIPHHAHILALEVCGVRDVVGLCSVGALRERVTPGTVVVPGDYMSTHPPPTFAESDEAADRALHIVPELDPGLRGFLADRAAAVAARWESDDGGERPDVRGGGVYAETRGPRFETRAEVRALARDADVVGMTAASEATLAQERGMRYAMLCVVDNWAHGVTDEPLSLEGFRARQAANRELAVALLAEVLYTTNRTEPDPAQRGDEPASNPTKPPRQNE